MISLFVLTMLAAGFAYSMKVETKLARNANSEAELEWLGRSGVEYCRWVLALSLQNPYDSPDQTWARGFGPLPDLDPQKPNPPPPLVPAVQNPLTLGHGTVTWSITDLESKFNINSPEPILQPALSQALTLMGVAPGEASPIVNSILDWIDPDDQTHLEGAETEFYQNLNPSYTAKNGPIDDLCELLLVRGVIPEIYYGPAAADVQDTKLTKGSGQSVALVAVGLTNLFTPLSDGKININTATNEVLQLLPGVDAIIAKAIVDQRQTMSETAPDGTILEGGPYRAVVGPMGLQRSSAVPPGLGNQLAQFCDFRSKTFQVTVVAKIGGYERTFFAILGRSGPGRVEILSFYWK